MRIAFGDPLELDYTPDTPYHAPLGGMQSSACYLAATLAAQGHQVYLACYTSTPGTYRGVRCVSWKDFTFEKMRGWDLDAFVTLHGPGPEQRLRSELAPHTRLVLWCGHAHDQPSVAGLADPSACASFDGVAFISEWQRREYNARFPLDPARTKVLRVAAAPAYADLFHADESLLAAKASPPVLAYTSTPFRGLHLLLSLFPRIRKEVPGARLRVHSSLAVYGVPKSADETQFGALYRELGKMEGTEMIGSLGQPEVARYLRETSVLAYPNIFAETACISLMEAMAAGCRVVTSHLGALPETGAGYATLIPLDDERAYMDRFVTETVTALTDMASGRAAGRLREQIDYARAEYSWTRRAAEWLEWLNALPVTRNRG